MTPPVLRFGAGDGAKVDLAKLYESRLLIQGVSGSGKSTLIRSLLEQTYGVLPHLVVDFDGDFVTLREKYDYVLVGPGGDVPIATKTAKITIRRLAELGVSAIFDISDMKFPDRREWVRLACEELVHLPRALWTQRLFVLDEAHIFAPERGSGESVATNAVIDVITLGRKRGLVTVCATQRLSKFHKDAAAELNNKLIGFTDDVDIQRAGDQLGMTKDQRAGLKLLETHTFYGYGPAISRSPVLVRTAMPQTKPPPRGKDRPAAPPARDKVKQILAQLVDLPKEAAQEAKTMEDLRRQNIELERRIRQAERGVATKTVEKPVRDEAAIARAVSAAVAGERKRFRPVLTKLQRLAVVATDLPGAVGELAQLLEVPIAIAAAAQPASAKFAQPRTAPPQRPPARTREPTTAAEGITPSKQRVLNSLAALEQLGIAPAERIQVAIFAGYTENGHFNNMLGELRTAGLLDYPTGGTAQLTDAGHAIADPGNAITSLGELHDRWLSKLSPSERKLAGALIDAHPEPMSRAELADQTGYTENGHFNNMCGKLRTMGLAAYPAGGQIVAADVLFPPGLA